MTGRDTPRSLFDDYPPRAGEVGVVDRQWPWGHARRHGARGDGRPARAALTNLWASVQAVSSIREIILPAGDYDIGDLGMGEEALTLRNVHDLRILASGARLVCNTTARSISKVLMFIDCERLSITGLAGRDDGYAPAIAWKGAVLVYIQNVAKPSGTLSGYELRGIEASRMIAPFIFAGQDGARIRDIVFDVRAMDCFYGPSFQNQGDDVRGYAYCFNVRRAYFPYGVTNHDVGLRIESDARNIGSNACIPITRSRADKGRDTSHIRVRASFGGRLPWGTLVRLAHQGAAAATGSELIDDIDVELAIDPGVTGVPASAVMIVDEAVPSADPYPTTRARFDHIRLGGNFWAFGATPINVASRQLTQGMLTLEGTVPRAVPAPTFYPGFLIRH